MILKAFTQYTERRNLDIIKIVNDDNFTVGEYYG